MNRRVSIFAALLVFAATLVYVLVQREATPPSVPGTNDTAGAASVDRGEGRIVEAFRGRASGLIVESGGEVVRTLRDDNEGSRHQRFVVELNGGHTVLVAHNIDLARRVPLREGDVVRFRGQYEWNERGGVVHWTHRDPRGQREGGWIRHRGELYR